MTTHTFHRAEVATLALLLALALPWAALPPPPPQTPRGAALDPGLAGWHELRARPGVGPVRAARRLRQAGVAPTGSGGAAAGP